MRKKMEDRKKGGNGEKEERKVRGKGKGEKKGGEERKKEVLMLEREMSR
jgi:hypothetical protein